MQCKQIRRINPLKVNGNRIVVVSRPAHKHCVLCGHMLVYIVVVVLGNVFMNCDLNIGYELLTVPNCTCEIVQHCVEKWDSITFNSWESWSVRFKCFLKGRCTVCVVVGQLLNQLAYYIDLVLCIDSIIASRVHWRIHQSPELLQFLCVEIRGCQADPGWPFWNWLVNSGFGHRNNCISSVRHSETAFGAS